MSTDGRYLYHHGQGVPPTHYEYTPYSQSSAHQPAYDNTPVPQQQPPARPIRSNSSSSSQSHSPHQQAQYNPPPSPYPPSYAPSPTYMAQPPAAPPPAPQPVWTGEGWSHHYGPSTFHPQHQSGPPPGSPYNSGPGRPDVTSSSSVETSRGYSSIAPPPPNSEVPSRRIDERQAAAPPPNFPLTYQPKIKRRESESSPPVSAVSPSATSTGLDFMKLLESYRSITTTFHGASMPPPGSPQFSADTMDRMLQAATYGAHMLDHAAASQQPSQPASEPPRPSPKETILEEPVVKESGDVPSPQLSVPAAKRQKGDETTPEGQTCLGCNATSTPEWRRGPLGPRTLCNACGLVYAKLIKKRVRDNVRGSGKSRGGSGANSQSLDDSEGDTDDDDDGYGSQDRRSEMGRD